MNEWRFIFHNNRSFIAYRRIKSAKIYGTEGFKKRGKYKEATQDLEDQFDLTLYSNP